MHAIAEQAQTQAGPPPPVPVRRPSSRGRAFSTSPTPDQPGSCMLPTGACLGFAHEIRTTLLDAGHQHSASVETCRTPSRFRAHFTPRHSSAPPTSSHLGGERAELVCSGGCGSVGTILFPAGSRRAWLQVTCFSCNRPRFSTAPGQAAAATLAQGQRSCHRHGGTPGTHPKGKRSLPPAPPLRTDGAGTWCALPCFPWHASCR